MAEQNNPNKESAQEPAEGSRETAAANAGADAGARERFDTNRAQRGERGEDEDAGGITNRPLEEEIENQRDLPPRGRARNPEKDHA
jgi:hypothetical protein